MDPLLIIKLLVLSYILISPFVSHASLLPFASTPVKILLLVMIVVVSFVDLQLAILLMIAFLVMIVNLNKDEVVRLQTVSMPKNIISQEQVKEHMVRGQTIYPQPSDIAQPVIDASKQQLMTPETFTQESDITQSEIPQTMSEFPKPYCKGVGSTDPYQISGSLFLYSTDDRTKPYEEYVRMLSPDSSLNAIQNNFV